MTSPAQSIGPGELDVELSEFLYHDVDSVPVCYYQAGKSAFRLALEALHVRDFSGGRA